MLGKESEKMSESGNVSDFFPETFRTARFYKKKKKKNTKKNTAPIYRKSIFDRNELRIDVFHLCNQLRVTHVKRQQSE